MYSTNGTKLPDTRTASGWHVSLMLDHKGGVRVPLWSIGIVTAWHRQKSTKILEKHGINPLYSWGVKWINAEEISLLQSEMRWAFSHVVPSVLDVMAKARVNASVQTD